MRLRHWLLGAGIGIITGLLMGAFYAYSDWQLNPGGIFRNQQGTNWHIVWDTVISWWLPVTGLITLLSWVVLYLVHRGRG